MDIVEQQLLDDVIREVTRHVLEPKGYEEESFVTPLTPVDKATSVAMAKLLTKQNAFKQPPNLQEVS